MDPYSPLFAVLRPGLEHVKVAIEGDVPDDPGPSWQARLDRREEVALRTGRSAADASSSTTESDAKPRETSRRIFALVTNVEEGYEQGCLFVLKRRRKDPSRVKIVDGLPILPDIHASIRQVPASSDQRRLASPSTSTSNDPTRLQVDMTLANKTISAVSTDAQAIRDLLKVVREAATIAEENAERQRHEGRGNDSARQTHNWVEQYMDVDRSAIDAKTPIFSRFTTSSIAPLRPVRPRARSPAPGEVKLSFGTFNVNGQFPGPETDLAAWLHLAEDDPDILVVGLQEADSSGFSYVVWTPHVEAAWTEAIERSMGRHASAYTKLASKQLVGVLIMVYVRTNLLPRISCPAVASVGIGFGGWAANKGATAVRFTLDAKPLCFVVSHLSAFHTPEARERRRWDYHEIVRRLKFVFLHDASDAKVHRSDSADEDLDTKDEGTQGEDTLDSAAESMLRKQLRRSSVVSTEDAEADGKATDTTEAHIEGRDAEIQRWTILDHDIVIWGGDLNFRVELSAFEVKRLIRKRQFEQTLLKFDELRSEMSANACFQAFHEQAIDFAPTYKFDRGTDDYDTSEKQRCPAWTDRVLWHEKQSTADDVDSADGQDRKASRLEPILYESAPTIRISDHKPVMATFILRTVEE